MTTALDRVREAISNNTILCIDDIHKLAAEMPVWLQDGLVRLAAGAVATYHSNGGAGVEDWKNETVEEHLRHANKHTTDAYWAADGDNHSDTSHNSVGLCEDGLRDVDHAACRIVMAFAREGMVNGKG